MMYHVIIQQIDRKATVQKLLEPTSEDTGQLHRDTNRLGQGNHDNTVPLPHSSSA